MAVNLRNYSGEYNIGLDMGTGSVGWAVTDDKGALLHFKKQPTWGSRLFESALPASEARSHRGQRRRYIRRRWRLNLLQEFFQEEMAKVDPEFFVRLNNSRTIEGDPIFNGSDFTKADYYDKYKTIYHLRLDLMQRDDKADIRLVYLALHNIVKHRGNFLREGKPLCSTDAKPDDAVAALHKAIQDWCDANDHDLGKDQSAAILDAFADKKLTPSGKRDAIVPLIGISLADEPALSKKCNKAIAAAIVGLSADFKDVFGELSCEKTKIRLDNEEDVEKLEEACPDDGKELFDAIRAAYSAYLLQGLLSHAPGKSISANMVAKYDRYQEDLALLKELVREYAPAQYDEFFRGPFYEGTSMYDANKAKGYTAYNLGTSKCDYESFVKEVKKLFSNTEAQDDPRYAQMLDAFDKQEFLRRLKTSDNGSIYYQLHLEEFEAIIDNQGRFYPFLKDEKDKLKTLVTFRIPYYVGPLQDNDAPADKKGVRRFSWAVRKPGQESVAIKPWNWDQVIDRNQAAQDFITRMTGMCTYLQGQDVLPKCSLLYEEFCVLNELNGLKVSIDGDKEHRLDAAQREGIMQELFHKHKTVKYAHIQDWIEREEGFHSVRVAGGQGETGLVSKLGSYIFFAKDIFGVTELDSSLYPAIEDAILWNTLFEDRAILKEKLEQTYGPQGDGTFTAAQIKKICRKRFAGWGRLSKHFLTGLKAQTNCGRYSIMDILREGDPNSTSRRGRAMNLMEILHDDELRFQGLVDEFNKKYYGDAAGKIDVNDLPGSPAIRRSLNQSIRIVEEIAGIAGKAPKNIFVEVTREEDARNKGRRTKRRYDKIKEALAVFKVEASQVAQLKGELKEHKPEDLDDERLMLYFAQGGKCLYSGEPIDINLLNAGKYEVDHIIPRSYIKDDSFENKALVLREKNQKKTDAMLIDTATRTRMRGYWDALHDAGLIGDKKFKNLLRDKITDNAMKGFVARQLVETSQMVKLIQTLLDVRFPDTKVVPVKASMTHDLREAAGLVKCREANNYHHAHDAFLACQVGLFIQMRHPRVYDNPISMTHAMRSYAQAQSKHFNAKHKMPGSSGFIVNSFMTSGFDKETGEIFKDEWDAEAAVCYMHKALNYRQCYITRMPYEQTGKFWDGTIYSPRNESYGSRLKLSLKDNLDPREYGGYSSEMPGYFFVYKALKPGNNKELYMFASVPRWLVPRIGDGMDALSAYAKKLARAADLEFIAVERSKILKDQLIEIDGERFYLTGNKDMRNASEMAFTLEEVALLQDRVLELKGKISKNSSLNIPVSDLVSSALERFCLRSKRLSNNMKLNERTYLIRALDERAQLDFLLALAQISNGTTNVVDLSVVDGPKNAARMRPSFSKELSDPKTSFYIIDQSVTGMFERKTRLGL